MKGAIPEHILIRAFVIESICFSLILTTFGLFNVEIFLKSYKLNLTHYTIGHIIYAIINTFNDVAGAWLADHLTAKYHKSRALLLQWGGLLWAFTFLLPWFRWKTNGNIEPYPFLAALHFVFSLSLYDTLFSFCAIVSGALLTDLQIPDKLRIRLCRIKTATGLISAFFISQIGQYFYDTDNLFQFRIYVVVLAVLFIIGITMFYTSLSPYLTPPEVQEDDQPLSQFTETVWLLLKLPNFKWWLGMEMLLETQQNFIRGYLRIFVEHFLHDIFSKSELIFIVSMIQTSTDILKLAIFSFIQAFGIYPVYKYSFVIKIVAASVCYFLGFSHWQIVLFFIVLNFVATNMPSSGYMIAMSNMNDELKYVQISNGRLNAPSSAGMFMGVNALFCKPMDSVLPIIASQWLKRSGFNEENAERETISNALFQLLVLPALVMTCFQLASWSLYKLHGETLERIQKSVAESEASNIIRV